MTNNRATPSAPLKKQKSHKISTHQGGDVLLRVKNLHKSFFDRPPVLDGVSLELHERESLVVIGGSGTGKSVLLRCIWGLLKPDSGQIWVDGVLINTLSDRRRQQQLKSFAFLFQGGALFDSLPVWENVAFSLLQQRVMSRSKAREKAMATLAEVDLDARTADIYPSALSGGMQKRVALARALAGDPRVVFFDEPTTGLDPIVSGTINELISRCVRERNIAAITITHDMTSLRKIGQRVALLWNGHFAWEGTVHELDTTDDPALRQFVDGTPYGPLTVPAPAK